MAGASCLASSSSNNHQEQSGFLCCICVGNLTDTFPHNAGCVETPLGESHTVTTLASMDLPQAVIKEDASYRPALWDLRRTFAPSVLVLAALILAFFLAFVEYDVPEKLAYSEHVAQYYTWLIDVEMMIFFGFGFLMTFLRRYSYGAVGLNFFTSALVMLEGVLIIGAVHQVMGEGHKTIKLDIPLIIEATFCAGSAMIAFGAVLGKTSPTQLTWLLVAMVSPLLLSCYPAVIYICSYIHAGPLALLQ